MSNIRKIYIWILITSVIWGTNFEIFYISGIGSVYPMRILLVIYLFVSIVRSCKKGLIVRKNDIIACSKVNFGLFWVWIFLLYLFTDKTAASLSAFVTYTMNILLILCIAESVLCKEKMSIALNAIAFNAIVLGIIGILECYFGKWFFRADLPTKWDLNVYGNLAPVTIFHNPNNYCMFMVFSLFAILLGCRKKILKMLCSMLVIAVCLITSCRSGILGIILGFAILLSIKYLESMKVKFFTYSSIGIMAVLYLGFKDIRFTNDRIFLWINTLYAAYKNKFIGIGPGNTKMVLSQTVINIVNSAKGGVVLAPHNYLLELLLETGIIGVLLIGIWFIKIMKKTWQYRHEYEGRYYFIFEVLIFLTSICVSTMTDFFQYWLFLGLMLAYIYRQEKCNCSKCCKG